MLLLLTLQHPALQFLQWCNASSISCITYKPLDFLIATITQESHRKPAPWKAQQLFGIPTNPCVLLLLFFIPELKGWKLILGGRAWLNHNSRYLLFPWLQASVHPYKGPSNPQMEGMIKVQIAALSSQSLVITKGFYFSFGGGNVLCNKVTCSALAGLDVPGEAAAAKADEIFSVMPNGRMRRNGHRELWKLSFHVSKTPCSATQWNKGEILPLLRNRIQV